MKRYSIIVILFFFAFGMSEEMQAQDLHLSQFYTNPMFLNPSMTGNFNGDYRVGANARNQWASVTVPYQTLGIFGDLALLEDEVGDNNWLGTGVGLFLDRAGDGGLRTIRVQGSVAFHKHISEHAYLSLGGGFAFVQKSIDFGSLTFSNQWDGIGFDGNLDPVEDFERNKFGYLDVNAGASINLNFGRIFRTSIGGALQHINRPLESFYFTDNNGGNNQLGYRPVAHMNAEIDMGFFEIHPAFLFTATKKTNEIIGGTNFAFNFVEEDNYNAGTKFYLGAWYRSTGSLIGLVGFQYSTYRVMLSYDYDVGALSEFSNGRNGFEISLTHVGGFREPVSRLECPRF